MRHTISVLVPALTLPMVLHGGSALAQQAPEAAEQRSVTARSADQFVDSIGVGTHLTYVDTAYGDYPLISQRLSESGIRHIRDGWGTGSSYASRFVREELGPKGIGITMVNDSANGSVQDQKEMVKRELLPVIEGVESLIEPDLRGAGWPALARDWTVAMSEAYRSDPATAGIPLLGPSMADTNNAESHAAMGDLSPFVDFGNTHDYPGDQYQMTDSIVDAAQTNMARMTPGRPVIATEVGFSNGTVNQLHPSQPEEQVGVVLPRVFLEHFRRGLPRTFTYELIDQRPTQEFEAGFGLLRNDGSKKPAFEAIAALTTLLADPGPAFEPGSLEFSLAGADDRTRTLLLQKRDGEFWLALWQQNAVYRDGQVLDPPDVPVTMTLNAPAERVRVHGLANAAPVATISNASTVDLQSSEAVTLVQITGVAP